MKKKKWTRHKIKMTAEQKATKFAAEFGINFDESNIKSVRAQFREVAQGKYTSRLSGKDMAIAYITGLTPDEFNRDFNAAKQWNPELTEADFIRNSYDYQEEIRNKIDLLSAEYAHLAPNQLSLLIATQIFGSP